MLAIMQSRQLGHDTMGCRVMLATVVQLKVALAMVSYSGLLLRLSESIWGGTQIPILSTIAGQHGEGDSMMESTREEGVGLLGRAQNLFGGLF
jgi:hypothetical protein